MTTQVREVPTSSKNTTLRKMLKYQRNEITEHHIYHHLAAIEKSEKNRGVLEKISQSELDHYEIWKKATGTDAKPSWAKVRMYTVISRILGLSFGVKLMERGEKSAQINYGKMGGQAEGIEAMARDENDHEAQMLDLLDEEKLRYVGSIVLGLSDALVELTGGMAGLVLALKNTRLIALTGLIMGLAAAMSMAASEFLSTKAEKGEKDPLKSAVYTGITYTITVMALIAPYLILKNPFASLACMMTTAVAIIAGFNYYVSVALNRSFRRHFLEMTGISMGVAVISFGIGYLVRIFIGVDV